MSVGFAATPPDVGGETCLSASQPPLLVGGETCPSASQPPLLM